MSVPGGEEDPRLHFALDYPLPDVVESGARTDLFLDGWCFHETATITRLSIAIDGEEHPVIASRMPRRDLGDAATAGPRNQAQWYRSGFWALVPIVGSTDPVPVTVELRAELASGGVSRRVLGTPVVQAGGHSSRAFADPRGEALVAICMATHEPAPELFGEQIASIRRQTYRNWICLISDDCSSDEGRRTIREAIADDPRFVVTYGDERHGFYLNFARVLERVPAQAPFVALADQDDRWHPEKLAVLVAAMADGVTLVFADMRLIDESGSVVSETFWRGRQNNWTDLATLATSNTVSGAAALFRADLLRTALPFPPSLGYAFHDHWLALCALTTGRISYVDRALHDYVQHGANVTGHSLTTSSAQLDDVWMKVARLRYFVELLQLMVFARILGRRCSDIDPSARTTLQRLATLDGSFRSAAWIVIRVIRGRRRNDAAAYQRERNLLNGLVWRWVSDMVARGVRRPSKRESLSAGFRFPEP